MHPRRLCALLLAVALLCTLARPLSAQDVATPAPTATTAPTATPSPTATPTVVPTPTDSVEVAVLKAQLETMRAREAWMLGVVTIALTSVIAIAAVVAALSYFSNRDVFENAKDELRKRIGEDVKAQIEGAQASMQSTLDGAIVSLDTKYAEAVGGVWDNVSQQRVFAALGHRRYNMAMHHSIEWLRQSQLLKHQSGEFFALGAINAALIAAKEERRKISIVGFQFDALRSSLNADTPQLGPMLLQIRELFDEVALSVPVLDGSYEDPPEPETN